MLQLTSAPQSALIVHAHPEPTSLCTAQMHVAAHALRAAGLSVDVIDLYARDWSPVLARGEFPPFDGPFKPQAEQQRAVREATLPAEVRADLDAVLAADLLVLSFPLWWFSLPAILKGWVDRVFVMGALFGGEHGVFDEAAQRGRQAMVLATTGGSAAAFEPGGDFGDLDRFLFHIHRGMFEFVGYEALAPVVTFAPARMSDEARTEALAQARARFDALSRDEATGVASRCSSAVACS